MGSAALFEWRGNSGRPIATADLQRLKTANVHGDDIRAACAHEAVHCAGGRSALAFALLLCSASSLREYTCGSAAHTAAAPSRVATASMQSPSDGLTDGGVASANSCAPPPCTVGDHNAGCRRHHGGSSCSLSAHRIRTSHSDGARVQCRRSPRGTVSGGVARCAHAAHLSRARWRRSGSPLRCTPCAAGWRPRTT